MTSLRGKLAVVTGASSGVGKATVQALVAEGVRVTAVARGSDGLHALRAEAGGVETVQADASDPAIADRLIGELKPDLVVLAAGIQPTMGPLAEQTWESFFGDVEHRSEGGLSVHECGAHHAAARGERGDRRLERSGHQRLAPLGRLRRRQAHAVVARRLCPDSREREE